MIRSITIEPVLNGFALQVGCQKVVFNSVKEMASEIQRYYTNPEDTEKRYIARAVNKMQDLIPTCADTNLPQGFGQIPDMPYLTTSVAGRQ